MAQRRSLAWTEVRVGILVITSFALLALAIFYVSGQSGFFVKKYTITANIVPVCSITSSSVIWGAVGSSPISFSATIT